MLGNIRDILSDHLSYHEYQNIVCQYLFMLRTNTMAVDTIYMITKIIKMMYINNKHWLIIQLLASMQ